ncbi:DUF2637 domain-containing protein [Arthrobacter bambusae]|uniref:Excisionase n=1 Tax=Arthrobacter bambusae TaxID=1338426 RepID=A0AAW8DGM4_9MICC|nr:DUF2637 domain-containing protein [Arthrobacter bambusae]MDP9904621.1 hypothetical protein [Arthrobacter bambusae]MDQ0129437.1 hypothetical protein [Arthrobacter bambusae]MDQ0180950.1 hypothetical protein [Arthrobacter bambusae]
MNTRIPNEPHKAVLLTAVGTTVLIALGAFILSFAALTDLAQRSGIEAQLAWIWPIIVDGMIVASTVAIVALNGHNRRAMVYPWTLLFFGAVVSTAANSVHAILTVDALRSGIPPVVSALVAAMPPVVLLAITHLTVHMYQKRAEAAVLQREHITRGQAEPLRADPERAALEEAYPAPEPLALRLPGHAPTAPVTPAPVSTPIGDAEPVQPEDSVAPALYEEMVQALLRSDTPTGPESPTPAKAPEEDPRQEDLPGNDPRLHQPASS